MNISDAIKKGNILREKWPTELDDYLNLYLGSGRFGGCFDEYGLMNNGVGGKTKERPGNTYLMHADHWDGSGVQDYWLPLMSIAWAGNYYHNIPGKYIQELDLYNGQLRTTINYNNFELFTKNFFNPQKRDLMGLELKFDISDSESMTPLMLLIEEKPDKDTTQSIENLISTAKEWACRVRIGTADSIIYMKVLSLDGYLQLKPTNNGVEIHFNGSKGHFMLIIGCGGYDRRELLYTQLRECDNPNCFEEDAVNGWHKRWGNAFIELPETDLQAFWARSLFYILCSYGPDVRCPAPPGGWSGNGWAYSFPQDLSYIQPALLRLGHFDIAKAWVEFYFSMIGSVRKFTKKTFDAEGTMWIWEFPIGSDWKGFDKSVPNHYHYEIHNAAYPARMARETALYIQEPKWAEEIAWPVICESARFYASILRQEEDKTWGINLIPSMGQDELGGQNQKNYICSLFSAQYCLKTAVEMAEEIGINGSEKLRWKKILKDGLAFERLYNKELGLYMTFEKQDMYEIAGKQKHPVQLNPIVFLPVGNKNGIIEKAYRDRYSLCDGAEKLMFQGWTLGAFLVASVHMGDCEGLKRGLSEMVISSNVSEDWVQFYESSLTFRYSCLPFFTTSHGLYLQAMNDCMVHEYWGELEIGCACADEWKEVSFHNLRVSKGKKISGFRKDGKWNIK